MYQCFFKLISVFRLIWLWIFVCSFSWDCYLQRKWKNWLRSSSEGKIPNIRVLSSTFNMASNQIFVSGVVLSWTSFALASSSCPSWGSLAILRSPSEACRVSDSWEGADWLLNTGLVGGQARGPWAGGGGLRLSVFLAVALPVLSWVTWGWGCLLAARSAVRACAQGAEFASRVPSWRDISCEEDSHLPTLTGLSSFKNHVAWWK